MPTPTATIRSTSMANEDFSIFATVTEETDGRSSWATVIYKIGEGQPKTYRVGTLEEGVVSLVRLYGLKTVVPKP
jgi:hypothetical protein